MKNFLAAVSAVALFSCGPNAVPNSAAPMEDESEIASTGEALLSNRADVWWPMQEGNSWTLKSSAGEVRTVDMQAVGDGMGWLTGVIPAGAWLGTSTTNYNSLYSWSESAGAWSPFLRFGYASSSWIWGSGACGTFTVKRIGTDLTVHTDAGDFTGARKIGFTLKPALTARCTAPAFADLTFAPGVGIIGLTNMNGEQFLLKSAIVNGKPIPAPSALKGSLKLNAASYTNKANTIRCITTPCPSNEVTAVAKATFTVTNTGTKSETVTFNSGCQNDLSLIDSSGKTVNTLSATRFCTLALTAFTLAAGQSKVYLIDVPLVDRQGQQLQGTYTAKAWLLPERAVSVSSAFNVKLQ
jgi:hypothetical protein